jgi:hypothetical protein
MSSPRAAATYTISTPYSEQLPASALATIRTATAEELIVIDFDETLFLRNSTEEYLNSVYPRAAGAVFMLGIKALKPWQLLPQRIRSQKVSKDWCLVVAVTLLFPWTLLIWQWRAKALARSHWNQPLIQALRANPQAEVVVATLGFDWIVNPLLKHLPLVLSTAARENVIACRFWQGAHDRAIGKCALVEKALGSAAVAGAIAITDATHDAPLLDKVKTPCLVVWPEAEYVPAMSDVYLPLFYSEKVKNPNKGHFIKRVLLGHWAFLAIALSFLSPHPILNAGCLLALVLSYWCVYEIGYQENDIIGEQYEQKPILSETYARYKRRLNLNTPAPWCWAMALALPALLLLEVAKRPGPLSAAFADVLQQGPQLLTFDLSIWLAFLVAVRVTFWLYNRFNEEARIWIYPFLQVQKLFGFTLLLGINSVGAVLLMSFVISRWLHYAIYRCGGDRWRFPLNIACLSLFVMLMFAAALGSETLAEVITWQSAIALGYCTLKAIKPVLLLKQRIDILGQETSREAGQETGQETS